MSTNKLKVALFVILLGAFLGITTRPALGQDHNNGCVPITCGHEHTVLGNITKIDGDMYTVTDLQGVSTIVLLTGKTKVQTHGDMIFVASEHFDRSVLTRGMRIQAHGRGTQDGQLAASWIRFHASDYRAQTSVESRAVPIERELLRQADKLEETSVVASTALKTANSAKEGADKALSELGLARTEAASAQSAAAAASARLASLDDFETTASLNVLFKAGSAILTPEAKAQLDEFAAKTANLKGFAVQVAAYASSEGTLRYNHILSMARAEAVVDYLVGERGVPIRRLVVPYSGGEMNPIADNSTREGREQNRRAEVSLLVSKGLAAGETVTAKTDK